MGAKVETVKKEVGDVLSKIYSKLTPSQGKYGSLILSAIIALVFLCTVTGRTVITCLGYLLFAYLIFLLAYKLYSFACEHSKAEPKPRPVKETASEETVEPDGTDELPENEIEGGHQISIDEIEVVTGNPKE